MGLLTDIPYVSKILVFCKEKVLNAQETLRQLVQRNNDLRMSIEMVLLNISRPMLKKLELAFKPGLSTVQWTSEHLDQYFENVSATLDELADFIKLTNDIKNEWIEEKLDAIVASNLIYLPDEPMSIFSLYDLNVKHRQQIGTAILKFFDST